MAISSITFAPIMVLIMRNYPNWFLYQEERAKVLNRQAYTRSNSEFRQKVVLDIENRRELLLILHFLVVNTVLFSIFLVFVWRYFFYIVDYYIHNGLKEYNMERKSGDTLRKLYFFINFRRVSRTFLKISVLQY